MEGEGSRPAMAPTEEGSSRPFVASLLQILDIDASCLEPVFASLHQQRLCDVLELQEDGERWEAFLGQLQQILTAFLPGGTDALFLREGLRDAAQEYVVGRASRLSR